MRLALRGQSPGEEDAPVKPLCVLVGNDRLTAETIPGKGAPEYRDPHEDRDAETPIGRAKQPAPQSSYARENSVRRDRRRQDAGGDQQQRIDKDRSPDLSVG